jgi:hypothetical protein
MAAGEITPEEALIVTKVLDGKRRALETLAPEAAATATPTRSETREPRLHSACNSPPAAPMPGSDARLPRKERRRLAALRRAAAPPRRWA